MATNFRELDDAAIGAVAELARLAADPRVFVVGSTECVLHDGKVVDARTLIHEPEAEALRITSLTGLLDYLSACAKLDNVDPDALLITGAVTRCAIRGPLREARDRETFLIADAPEQRFQFARWLPTDEFMIGLRTCFEATPERDELVKLVSTIVQGEQVSVEDDGVSQRVAVEQRAGARGLRTIAPVHVIKPYRTFRELEQPEGLFLLRIHTQSKPVTVALHEADGGAWEVTVRQRLRVYLSAGLEQRQLKCKVLV